MVMSLGKKKQIPQGRAFSQLDADIIGDANPSQADAEICNIIGESLKKIGLSKDQFKINVSNKKILQGLINELKIEKDRQYKVLKSIDKLDRLGTKGVEELLKKVEKINQEHSLKGANYQIIKHQRLLVF